MRVARDHGIDCRVRQLLGDADDRTIPCHRRIAIDGVGTDGGSLVDHDDLHPDAFSGQPLRLGDDPVSRREELQAGGGPGRDQLGRVLQGRPDDADLDPVDGEDHRRGDPVRRLAGCLLDDVRGEEREVGTLLVAEQAFDAVVELVVAVRGRV
jgi:hypothetical protein